MWTLHEPTIFHRPLPALSAEIFVMDFRRWMVFKLRVLIVALRNRPFVPVERDRHSLRRVVDLPSAARAHLDEQTLRPEVWREAVNHAPALISA